MSNPSADTFSARAAAFVALARVAALETCRQPLFLLLSLGVSLGILLFPLVLNYTLGDSARIVRDSAFSLFLVGGVALAAHSAVATVSRDLRRGPAAVWLAADCPRALWFAAKCAGLALALLLYAAAALPAVLLAVRACGDGVRNDWPTALAALSAPPVALAAAALWNLLTRQPAVAFAAAALPVALAAAWLYAALLRPSPDLPPPPALDWPILQAGLLLLLPILMAATLGATLAIRLPPGVALLLTLLVFAAGLFSSPVLAPLADAHPAAAALRALLPDVQACWLADALDAPAPFPSSYLPRAAAAALLWSAAVILLATLSLRHREIQA